MPSEIMDKVLHFGAFEEALKIMVDLMKSEYPCSVIVRGQVGSGRKTLIGEASNIAKVQCIDIDPLQFNEDFGALRRIVDEIGLKTRGSSVSELTQEIRDKADKENKLVIVLHHFEDFCRKRQSLLYNLMNLLQTNINEHDKGPNITLIGLTTYLDWTDNIEKRVRSRLNAKLIDLSYPYRNLKEYIQFTSMLLGDHKLNEQFKEQLSYMYHFGSQSVTYLKHYLNTISHYDKKRRRLVVNFDPDRYRTDYQRNFNILLKRRLLDLTSPQLELIKLIVCYYYNREDELDSSISLKLVCEYAQLKNMQTFSEKNEMMYRDADYLLQLGFLDMEKLGQSIGFETKFRPTITGKQFKAVLQMDPALSNLRTDLMWKKLK